MKNLLLLSALVFLALLLCSCEKDKTALLDSSLDSPFLNSVSVLTTQLNLDTTTSSAVTRLPNGGFLISDSIWASVSDADGAQDIKKVMFQIYKPGSSNYFSSGTLKLTSTQTAFLKSASVHYSGSFSFTIERADVGPYKIEVFAQDQSGLTSNALLTTLLITRNNSAPQLSEISLPDTVYLPPNDSLLIGIVAAASDSDGLGDITEVFFYSLNSSDPTRKFFLYDDGNASRISGDVLAGDGYFTAIVGPITQAVVGRTFFFEFHATDKQGAEAEAILKSLTVR